MKSVTQETVFAEGSELQFKTEALRRQIDSKVDLFLRVNELSPQMGAQIVGQMFSYSLAVVAEGLCRRRKNDLFRTIIDEMDEIFLKVIINTKSEDCEADDAEAKDQITFETDAMKFLDKPYAYFPHFESLEGRVIHLFFVSGVLRTIP